MLRVKEISGYEEFKAMEGVWGDFISKSGTDNLYLTHDWIEPYIRNCCNVDKLIVLTVFEDSVLIGIAPLMIRKHSFMGITAKSVCFIGTGESDRMDFIISASKEKCILSVMDHLMSFSKDWDFLDFQEIPGHSGTAETIEKWSNSRKLKSISIFRDKSFFMDLNSNADFFLKKVSKKLNTKMKKLNKNMRGHLEFRRYEHQEPKENFFSDIQSIAKLSWKAEKQRSIFLKEKIRDFHKELFSKFAESGHLDVSILRLDNMPIAYMYNFLYNNRLYNYSIEFNKKYSHVSPGSMLMLWLIKDSIQKGIREIDFGRGEEEWKKRLTRDCRIHAKVMIFNRTFYGRFLYLLYSGIEFIKSRRIIYAILRRLKQRFV